MRYIILSLLVLTTASSVWASEQTVPADSKHTRQELQQLTAGEREFAVQLYKQLAGEHKENLLLSPGSVRAALAMAYAGAEGRTAQQMTRVLAFGPLGDRVHPVYGQLLKTLNAPRELDGEPAYQLSVANALWAQRDYPIRQDYRKLLDTEYQAELRTVNFNRPAEAAEQINDWVTEQTREKISEIVTPSAIQPPTRLVLTNAVHFKSAWQETFSEHATRPQTFHLPGGKTMQVPMMSQVERFGWHEDPNVKVLELPYRGREMSMVVILPKKRDGLGEVTESLTAKKLAAWLEGLKPTRVHVEMPKYQFESQFSLGRALATMGMSDAFSPQRADFGGMSSAERLFISAVLHKTYIDVHEKGTEAAAATAVILEATAMPPQQQPKRFRADHPFLFAIRHRPTDSLLFVGHVAQPSPADDQ